MINFLDALNILLMILGGVSCLLWTSIYIVYHQNQCDNNFVHHSGGSFGLLFIIIQSIINNTLVIWHHNIMKINIYYEQIMIKTMKMSMRKNGAKLSALRGEIIATNYNYKIQIYGTYDIALAAPIPTFDFCINLVKII